MVHATETVCRPALFFELSDILYPLLASKIFAGESSFLANRTWELQDARSAISTQIHPTTSHRLSLLRASQSALVEKVGGVLDFL